VTSGSARYNAYANHHVRRVQAENTYAQSRGNKLPEAQLWIGSDGLTAVDWAVVTEYMDVSKPLKAATKRPEGRGNSGRFGAIVESIPVFEYILNYYEQRVQVYEAVDYNTHDEAPVDHLAINLRAAWAMASEYYAKLDLSPAYYAATILHPYYKPYCDSTWTDRADWLKANNRNFRALWAQYNTPPRVVRRPKVLVNDMGDAIDSLIDPSALAENRTEEDEFDRCKRNELRTKKGTEHANNATKY
jgi:hypothetical protein